MGLLALGLVLIALVGFATSATLAATRSLWLSRLAAVEPAERAWWLLGALAAPALAGASAFVLALGPCIATLARGLPDGCHEHGGSSLDLCLRHAPRASALAWALALLATAPLAARAWRVARAVLVSRDLVRRLRPVATTDPRGFWAVPGAASFVVGWPRGVVCVGRELARALRAEGLRVVLAHERAHLRRGDLHRKLAARLLAALHVPSLGDALRERLDVAIEQACDADAARTVGDPLLVAQTLVDAARLLPAARPCAALVGFVAEAGGLEQRVEALCAAQWRSSGGALRVLLAVLGAAIGAAIAGDRVIHDAAEALLQRLGG